MHRRRVITITITTTITAGPMQSELVFLVPDLSHPPFTTPLVLPRLLSLSLRS
jgi:hypothetical protein